MVHRNRRCRAVPANWDGHVLNHRNGLEPTRGQRSGQAWSSGSWASSRDWGGANLLSLPDVASAGHRPGENPDHAAALQDARRPFPGRPRTGCCQDAASRDAGTTRTPARLSLRDADLAEPPSARRSHPPLWRRTSLRQDAGRRGAETHPDVGRPAWVPRLRDEVRRVWEPGDQARAWVRDAQVRTAPLMTGLGPRGSRRVSPRREQTAPAPLRRDAALVWLLGVSGLRVWQPEPQFWARTLRAPCAPLALQGWTRRWKRTRPCR